MIKIDINKVVDHDLVDIVIDTDEGGMGFVLTRPQFRQLMIGLSECHNAIEIKGYDHWTFLFN